MKKWRKELLFSLSFLLFPLLLWIFLYNKSAQEEKKLVAVFHSIFHEMDSEKLYKECVLELHRRANYYFHSEKKEMFFQEKKFVEFARKRYGAELSVISHVKGLKNAFRLISSEENPLIEFTCCDEEFAIQGQVRISSRLIFDTMNTLCEQKKTEIPSPAGISLALLESNLLISQRDLVHLQDYARYTSTFELDLGDRFFYVKKMDFYPVHLVVILDKSLRLRTFLGDFFLYFFMGFVLIAAFFFVFRLFFQKMDTSLRLFFFVFAMFAMFGIFFYERSLEMSRQRTEFSCYLKEKDLVIQNKGSLIELDYERLRPFLPLVREGMYRLENQETKTILVFKVTEDGFYGIQSGFDPPENSLSSFFMLLVFMMGLGGLLLWFSASNRRFFRRYEQALSLLENPGDFVAVPGFFPPGYEEFVSLFHSLHASIQEKEMRQRFLSREVCVELEKQNRVRISEKASLVEGVFLFLGPNPGSFFALSSARASLACWNQFASIVYEIVKRYEGVSFYDHHLTIGVLFNFENKIVARQRAFICALDLFRVFERDLPSEISQAVFAMVIQGQASFCLPVSRHHQELLVSGFPLDLWYRFREKKKGLFLYDPQRLVAMNLFLYREDGDFLEILGVKDLEQHLELLDCPVEELQKRAIELVGLQKDERVLQKLLDIFPGLEGRIQEHAGLILRDYLTEEKFREIIFSRAEQWAKTQELTLIRALLEIYEQSLIFESQTLQGANSVGLPAQDSILEKSKSLKIEVSRLEFFLELGFDSLKPALLRQILNNWSKQVSSKTDSYFEEAETELKLRWMLEKFASEPSENWLNSYFQAFENEVAHTHVVANLFRLAQILTPWHEKSAQREVFFRFYAKRKEDLRSFWEAVLFGTKKNEILMVLAFLPTLEDSDLFCLLLGFLRKNLDSDLKKEAINSMRLLGANRFLMLGLR